jgi:pyruvate formate lyase activating enzyme
MSFLSKKIDNETAQCLICSHFCKIKNENRGICGVRKNEKGDIISIFKDRVLAQSPYDPIEKKPLFHFMPGTKVFSIGTGGCNFSCKFCQNWEISQFGKEEKLLRSSKKISSGDIISFCIKEKIPSIAYTYNEPAVFLELALNMAKLAKKNEIKNVFVTNGFLSRYALNEILPFLDAANIDLKSFRNDFYKKLCGGRLEPVLDNIKFLHKNNVWIEVTTLLITDENDSEEELRDIAGFLASVSPDIPWHISRYFPKFQMKNRQTPIKTIEKAYKIGKEAGLKYVYTGNLRFEGKEDTFCPTCSNLLIKRDGYLISENHLQNGACPNCKTKIAGRF